MGQMDLSCPQTVQSEIRQKCRENYSPSSSLFQIWIIFDRFEVIVKNLSQPLKFWGNFGCFLRFSPQDGIRIIFKTTGLFKLHQNTQFLKIWWKSVE